MSSDEYTESEDDHDHLKKGDKKKKKSTLERYSYKHPGAHPRFILPYQPNNLFHCQSFEPTNDIERYHSRTILACVNNGLVMTKRSQNSGGLERVFDASDLRTLRRSVTRGIRPEGVLKQVMIRIGMIAVQVQSKEWRLYLIPESLRDVTNVNEIDLSRCVRLLQMDEIGVVLYRVHCLFDHKPLKEASKFVRSRFKGLPISIIEYFSESVCLPCLNERARGTDGVLQVWYRAGDPLSMAIQALIIGAARPVISSSSSTSDDRTEPEATCITSNQPPDSMEVDSEPVPNTTSDLVAASPVSSHTQPPSESTDSSHQLSVLAAAAASLT